MAQGNEGGPTMKLFLDTASVQEIRTVWEIGILDGVTTNPTRVAKEGRELEDVLREICALGVPSVPAEVVAADVSPFIGRLDDHSENRRDFVRDILTIYRHHEYPTEVWVASVRHPMHVLEAARLGADIATMP